MSGGLLALLDDIAALTKLAAAQIDDVAAQAAKASAKAAGVVIDDSAVTPKYVVGLPAARELPIVWQIARASLFNKLVILLPAALLLNQFAPWLLTPLLMIGGCYLCYEGAHKIWHLWVGKHDESQAQLRAYGGGEGAPIDAAHLERERVAGAIKTDFVLSAEIMAIALSAIEADSLITLTATLAVVAIGITAIVYGVVALFVKADDIGLKMSQTGTWGATRSFGRGIVKAMPTVLAVVSAIGTAAMLWVGGNILTHGLAGLGYPAIEQSIYAAGKAVAGGLPEAITGIGQWFVRASIDGLIGLAIGLLLIPIVAVTIAPLFSSKSSSH